MILKKKRFKILRMILALTLVSAFALTFLAACGGEETVETQSSDNGESSVVTTESSKPENTDSSVADDSSETVYTENSTEESAESTESDESVEINDESSTYDEESSEAVSTPDDESSDVVIEPEILGNGTKDDPFLIIPGESMSVTTYDIGAGETQYYGIYRVGGLDVTVTSGDINIVCDGEKHTPKDGTLKFRVITAMPSEAIVFEITNTSASNKVFELNFENPVGTYANPVEFSVGKEFKASLTENDETGYYFKLIAEKDGVIRFKVVATKDAFLAVTNNRSYAQRTTDEDGTVGENGEKYVEIEVQKGDELVINVCALPNKRGKRPAIDITVSGEYK